MRMMADPSLQDVAEWAETKRQDLLTLSAAAIALHLPQ